MITEKTKQQLEKLKAKQASLKAQIQRVENSHKIKQHKLETHKKILIGTYYLDKTHNENSLNDIKKIMNEFLIRDHDRLLFNLPVKSE